MEKIRRVKASQIPDATDIDGFKALGIKENTDGTVDNVKVPMDLLKGNPFTYEDFTPEQIEDLKRPILEAVQDDLAQLADEFQKLLEFLQVGYWVHKDTGVKTYFGLDDPSIVDGIMSNPSWASDCSEVKIPSGVTGLGEDCFIGCSFLTSITIPEGVTSIGEYCFDGCSSLTSINIPESVTNIGHYCFYFCSSLTLATVLPAIPPSLGSSAFENTHAGFNIKVRSPYVDDYKAAANWINYADKISAI